MKRGRELLEGLVRWVQRVDRCTVFAGPAALLLVAFAYYATYFMHGLNLGGEGGTTAVLAMRLMEGQRPIVDTFLGYNVLWFLPVAWLFTWTGPDYLAMKAFFFVLCAVSALLGWVIVWRVTRSGLLAFATGLLLILIPGMIFRNYMGLLGVANQLALLSAFLLPTHRSRVLLIAVSGLVLGLTYLIRIEVGLFMSLLWLGLLVLHVLSPGALGRMRMKESLLGGGLGLCALVLVHVPFAADAWKRDYAPQFFGQYSGFISLLRWELEKQFGPGPTGVPVAPAVAVLPESTPPSPEQPSGMDFEPPTESAGQPQGEGVHGRRPKPPVLDIIVGKKAREQFFAAALYFPLLLCPLLVVGALVAALKGFFRRDEMLWRDSLIVLVSVGSSLTLFPQYFFFRPDTPHITEFMIPFLPALVCSVALFTRRVLLNPSLWSVAAACCFVALLGLQGWVHFRHAWPKESAGTAAARGNDTGLFVGQNNVVAKLRPDQAADIQALHDAIVANSLPGDWVVALPYSPTINFMTDRPSYLWDLYTDNTMAGPRFDSERISEILKYQPAAVVIDHRAINNIEASRLPNWAPTLYAFLQENYVFVGTYQDNELFLRPDKVERSTP